MQGPSSGDKVIPIFRANGGERVTVTPRDSASGSGGVSVINNIDARGADPASEARIYRAMEDNRNRTLAQVRDAIKRRRI